MDFPAGPSRVDRSRIPIKNMKTHILWDAELLDILENEKWISSDEKFDDDFDECSYSSDGDYVENESDDLQNNVISDFVGFGGNEVDEVLTESYSSTNFNWSTDSPHVNHFEFTATPGLKCLPNGDKPIDYFNLLVTVELFGMLVEETNIMPAKFF